VRGGRGSTRGYVGPMATHGKGGGNEPARFRKKVSVGLGGRLRIARSARIVLSVFFVCVLSEPLLTVLETGVFLEPVGRGVRS
jgi:hypothetical protein